MRIFKDLEYVERLGSGVPYIVSRYGSEIFKLMSSVIRYAYLFDEVEEIEETTQKPPENHLKTQSILSEIEKNPYINRTDLSQVLGLTINQIRGHLENLKNEGVITRIGSNRKGYWDINNVQYYPNTTPISHKNPIKTTQKPPKKTHKNHLKHQSILSAIEKNPDISRVVLSQLLGLTINQIRGRLENLVKEGVIRRVGSNRSGHWELVKDEN